MPRREDGPQFAELACRSGFLAARDQRVLGLRGQRLHIILPIGPEVVRFYGLYVESYKVIPKRNYLGAYGYVPLWVWVRKDHLYHGFGALPIGP